MLIDWFTVIAQTVNFLILVWLMKRYLYQPILTAIDTREARIASQLKDAAATHTEAVKERDEFRQKNDAFERSRDALLVAAQNGAKVERQRLVDEARKSADALREKLDAAVQSEREMLNREVAASVQREVFAIARQALAGLATVGIEAQIGNVFVDRLRALEGNSKAEFAAAVKTSSQPALVRSAFELPVQQREDIQQALKETFDVETPVKFATASRLVCGIELSVSGQKIAWSIDDYLTSLERRMNELLAPPANIEAMADPIDASATKSADSSSDTYASHVK